MKTSTCPSIDTICKLAQHSDFYEESAEDYLADRGLPLASHSTANILRQAWAHGWRPL